MSIARTLRRATERQKQHKRDTELYVYSARCTWHGSISETKLTRPIRGHQLPACPHCGSVLMQYDNRAAWDKSADDFLAVQPAGSFDADLYRRWLQWLHDRDTCEPIKDWDWRQSMAEFGARA